MNLTSAPSLDRFLRVKRPQRLSPMGAIMQAVMESLAENGVLVVDSPGSL